jgi:general secretion pathway protein E
MSAVAESIRHRLVRAGGLIRGDKTAIKPAPDAQAELGRERRATDESTLAERDRTLGEWLVAADLLSELDLKRTMKLAEQQHPRRPLANLLVDAGLVSERDVARVIAACHGLPLLSQSDYPVQALCTDILSRRFLQDRRVIPVALGDHSVTLAMADPFDEFAARAVALATGKRVACHLGVPSEISAALEELYGEGRTAMGQILGNDDADLDFSVDDVEQLRDMASEAPVIRLVNVLIQRAAEAGASDIHVEPFEDRLAVRYRIDGMLHEMESPPARMAAALISRVKIMARLNIAERRLPQDGRLKVRLQGREIDVRVSTVPTMHGESVVMRLLNRDDVVLDFKRLGFADDAMAQLDEVLSMAHGMLLVTGPTGSGKTTTLYTALDKLNTEQRKIITAEDPVEYQISGINQIQVKPSIDFTFASALRSIVRQDPDVIMVGEMRDIETARICVQSALTGHLVLSTLHTNDAAGSITRLLDMGVEDYLLTSTLNGILGQRLARRLCEHCREDYIPNPAIIEKMGLSRLRPDQALRLYKPVGCSHCGNSGFRGRVAILEILVMSDPIRDLILAGADAMKILAKARELGMRTMFEDGCLKALDGLTTIEEVVRISKES